MEQMARQAEQVRLMIEQSKKTGQTPPRGRTDSVVLLISYGLPFLSVWDSLEDLLIAVLCRLRRKEPQPVLNKRSFSFTVFFITGERKL
jgi:hypothetical protein